MLRIAICDDMTDILCNTRTLIEQWNEPSLPRHIDIFDNGDALIAAHKESPFNIIILDVVMPLLDGIETAREIRHFDKDVKIVFLTSASEYAVDSYTVKASNYLLKPVEPVKLYACLKELAAEFEVKSKYISIRSFSTVYRINIDTIEYIEAQNKYVHFHLSDGRTITTVQPLYSFETSLTYEDGFFQCHRSYIVNLQRVDTYTSKEAHMRIGTNIPISRKYQKDFETAYFDVIFGKAGEKEC